MADAANVRVIREALKAAGMKLKPQDDLGASADRLRAFWMNPQQAFEDWKKSQLTEQTKGQEQSK